MNAEPESLLLAYTLGWPLLLLLALSMKALRAQALRLVPTAAVPALLAAILPTMEQELALPWLLLGSSLGLDEVSNVYLLFSAILWTAGAMALPSTDKPMFCSWFLLTMTANFGVLLARDIPLFFFAYAVMSLASFGLVIHRRSAESRQASLVYLVFALIGEMVLLAAMMMIAQNAATMDLEHIFDRTPQDLLIALLLIGFGIKAGVPLLHMALPRVYAVVPLAAAVPMAGALLHLGLYGWMRFLPLGQIALPEWSVVFASVGTLAVVYGVVVGLTQRAAGSLLAYSSISQTGLMLLGLAVGLASPDHWQVIQPILLLYALHHALTKGALFNGMRKVGWKGVWLWLPAAFLAGLPMTGGALVKEMLKAQVYLLPGGWPVYGAWVLLLSSAGTTLLMARFLYLTLDSETHRGGWKIPMSQGALLGAMLLLPWLWALPISAPTVPSLSALFTVLLAAGLGWFVYKGWFERTLARIPALPAGDILVLLEALLRRIPPPRPDHPTQHSEQYAAPATDTPPVMIAILERGMRRWQVAVTLLLIFALGALFLLSP